MARMFRNFDDNNKSGGNRNNNQNRPNNNNNNFNTGINNNEISKLMENEAMKQKINSDEFNQFKDKYKNKTDDEILKDAKEFSNQLKQQMGEQEFNNKMKEIKKFEAFLNKEQKAKLNKFLKSIE